MKKIESLIDYLGKFRTISNGILVKSYNFLLFLISVKKPFLKLYYNCNIIEDFL